MFYYFIILLFIILLFYYFIILFIYYLFIYLFIYLLIKKVTLFDLKQFCNYVYLQEVKTAANKMITQYEKNIEI